MLARSFAWFLCTAALLFHGMIRCQAVNLIDRGYQLLDPRTGHVLPPAINLDQQPSGYNQEIQEDAGKLFSDFHRFPNEQKRPLRKTNTPFGPDSYHKTEHYPNQFTQVWAERGASPPSGLFSTTKFTSGQPWAFNSNRQGSGSSRPKPSKPYSRDQELEVIDEDSFEDQGFALDSFDDEFFLNGRSSDRSAFGGVKFTKDESRSARESGAAATLAQGSPPGSEYISSDGTPIYKYLKKYPLGYGRRRRSATEQQALQRQGGSSSAWTLIDPVTGRNKEPAIPVQPADLLLDEGGNQIGSSGATRRRSPHGPRIQSTSDYKYLQKYPYTGR